MSEVQSQDVPSVRVDDPDIIAKASVDVPGHEGVQVHLELDQGHQIWVSRPAAWTGSFQVGPERYRWRGGVPDPDAPGIPHNGPYDSDDLAWREPIRAVMRALRRGEKETTAGRNEARVVWDGLWKEFAQHLDARAARHCYNYEYTADLYKILAHRNDLSDHLDVCPALGPFLTRETAEQIPEVGWSLTQVAGFLLAPKGQEAMDLSPGFMSWARSLTWDKKRLPNFPKGDKRLPAMRGFVRNVANHGDLIDPNGIHKLEADEEWLLLNLALASPRTAEFAPKILTNPASSVKATKQFFPPDEKIDKRARLERVLEVASEWWLDNPERMEQIPGFKKITEEEKKWDQGMRRAEYGQQLDVAKWRADREASEEYRARRAAQIREEYNRRFQEAGVFWRLAENIDPTLPFPNEPPVTEYRDDHYVMVYHPNAAGLAEESRNMNHCVVTHAWRCQQGTERVFSLRKARDPEKPIATIAVDLNGRIMEARGPRNGALPQEVQMWIADAVRRVTRMPPRPQIAAAPAA